MDWGQTYQGKATSFFQPEPGRWHVLGHNFDPPDAFDISISDKEIREKIPDFRWTATYHGAEYRTRQDELNGVYTLRFTFRATGNGAEYVEPFDVRVSHMGKPLPVLNAGVMDYIIARAIEGLG